MKQSSDETTNQDNPHQFLIYSMVHEVESAMDFDYQMYHPRTGNILIEFFDNTCEPCKKIDPYVESLALEYASNLDVLKVDVNQFNELAEKYNVNTGDDRVTNLPTFVFVKNDENVQRISGPEADPNKIENTIKELLH